MLWLNAVAEADRGVGAADRAAADFVAALEVPAASADEAVVPSWDCCKLKKSKKKSN